MALLLNYLKNLFSEASVLAKDIRLCEDCNRESLTPLIIRLLVNPSLAPHLIVSSSVPGDLTVTTASSPPPSITPPVSDSSPDRGSPPSSQVEVQLPPDQSVVTSPFTVSREYPVPFSHIHTQPGQVRSFLSFAWSFTFEPPSVVGKLTVDAFTYSVVWFSNITNNVYMFLPT